MSQRQIGGWLLAAGIVLAVVGAFLWAGENSRVAKHNRQAELSAGFSAAIHADNPNLPDVSGQFQNVEANHAPSIVLWVGGGASALFGMLLIAGAAERAKTPDPEGPRAE